MGKLELRRICTSLLERVRLKKYQVLKFDWKYDFPRVLAKSRQEILDDARAPLQKRRDNVIQRKLRLVAMHHLEIGDVDDLREQTQSGVDLVVDYFCGDWWKPEGFARLTDEVKEKYGLNDPQKYERALSINAVCLENSRPSDSLEWYTPLRAGLLMGGLTGRWDDVGKICSWFDTAIPPEYCAGEIEDQTFQLFICIAGELRAEPMNGANQLLAKVKECRLKRPRLLCAAWEAAIAKDQTAFNKAFVDSVLHFVAKPVDSNIPYDIAALPQSIIWLIAEHRGLSFPEMSDKCKAAVITRESAGFA